MEHEPSPYIPSEKRFEISQDEISRERLKVVKEIFEELSQRIPTKVAVSLYGSLSKGRELSAATAPASDIDLVIYVDQDDLMNNYQQWLRTDEHFSTLVQENIGRRTALAQLRFRDRDPNEIITVAMPSGEQVQMTIAQYLAREVAKPVWTSVERYAFEIINRHLDESAQNMAYTGETSHIQVSPIQLEGPASLLTTATRLAQALDNNQRSADALAEDLAYFFALDVGGGLRNYRQHFLKQLQALEDQSFAQRLWRLVDQAVREQERGGVVAPEYERQFPATLEEAIRYYGADNS